MQHVAFLHLDTRGWNVTYPDVRTSARNSRRNQTSGSDQRVLNTKSGQQSGLCQKTAACVNNSARTEPVSQAFHMQVDKLEIFSRLFRG